MATAPIRVLIADDHPLFRQGVASSLAASSDFDVVAEAANGAEAVALALQLRPDLALLDVSMPVMDGIEAAARLSAHLPSLRIMMLTVSETPESLLAALKAGAHGYVLKGVSASDLRAIAASLASGEAYVSPSLAAEMLTEFSRPREPDQFSTLTSRESDVLALLSQGLSNRAIADALHLAEKTVKHHMTVILQKLQVRSRTEAALMAVQRGLIPRGDRR
jgi:two-component system, NarL family, nitrate/nitrite response regulator NarL